VVPPLFALHQNNKTGYQMRRRGAAKVFGTVEFSFFFFCFSLPRRAFLLLSCVCLDSRPEQPLSEVSCSSSPQVLSFDDPS